jgi:hypothetical protein
VLVERKTCIEGFADEAEQRADAQRQEGRHLFENAEARSDVERIDRSGPNALIEDEGGDADDDMRAAKRFGLLADGGEHGQRFAGIIGDVHGAADGSAGQLCRQLRIDLILGPAFTGEDQVGPGLQQRQFDGQGPRNIDADTIGHAQQSGESREPNRAGNDKGARNPALGTASHARTEG